MSALSIGPTEENWRSSFEVDLMHTVRVAETALPHLERSDAGSSGSPPAAWNRRTASPRVAPRTNRMA